jgi:quercetin dioxygenase-like cupin family protein
MKPKTLRLTLGALAGASLCAAAAFLYLPRLALATPALNFNSEILARSSFEQIAIGIEHHPHRGKRGSDWRFKDNDDDVDENDRFRVRITAQEPSDVYVVRNTVPPGGYSGWHTHPGPSIVSVKSGTATVYEGDDPSCTPHTYPAGSGFVDEGGGHVHMVSNEGTDTLEVVAFQIVPAGSTRRVDMPSPGGCRF